MALSIPLKVILIFGNPWAISIYSISRVFPTMWRMAPNMITVNINDVESDVIFSLNKRRSLFSDLTSVMLFTAEMAEPHNYRWVCLTNIDCDLSIQFYCWLNLPYLTNFTNIPSILKYIFTTYSKVEHVCLLKEAVSIRPFYSPLIFKEKKVSIWKKNIINY